MILLWLILLPLMGGALAWYAERFDARLPAWIALVSLLSCLGLLLPEVLADPAAGLRYGLWLQDVAWEWIPRFNIQLHLALDNISLLLVLLTLLMGLVALSSAWEEIVEYKGFFYFNFLWSLAGILGVFLAMDMLLFFLFWEVMLVPMYFLIAIWGHENRRYAAIKFFLFTQAGGLLMLLSIIALVLVHYQQTGLLSFDYQRLLAAPITSASARWICLGFILAFLVKLPAFPFHSWLPDAHTQAPTPASVILAAVLLKTGGYGLLRFVLPLFPSASHYFAPLMLTLAVIGIVYGAVMAFSQTDMKRLVAYSSVSHMGFVLLGCFSFNLLALQGVMLQMLAHGVSTSALFVLVGMVQHRLHTRDLNKLGGLWQCLPRLSAMGLFFAIAALGMPGLGNFVAEFLVLLGGFEQHAGFSILAASGLVLGAIYCLRMISQSFWGQLLLPRAAGALASTGPDSQTPPSGTLAAAAGTSAIPADLNAREAMTLAMMALALLGLGLHPQPLLSELNAVLSALLEAAS
ncbi:complex I subunit 4 family protein [Shewanella salipaludis]|uniref:NADH-quinone oxidoreductase subunit M n=1 Tax=Shewanella salipaludis TaxID=2723052 RepID=A0A972JL96_9GAMM|nr:NADH-quinone oxidoreductase subunit M [Shewanella salipaludis]NMH63846.1 NADH-quinone oxidoreductase subunit M [Shewanella salipaludis]